MTGANPFAVGVARLRRAPGTSRRIAVAGPLPDLAVVGCRVPEDAEVVVEGVLTSVSGGVAVVGTVATRWASECRRCLGPADGALRIEVHELFAPGGDGADAYPLVDDVVDLSAVARDAVLLSLPLAPLCAADCRGLCPECGADLNRAPCGGHHRRDERWAALDALLAEVPDQP